MSTAKAWAAASAGAPLAPFSFERRELRANDVRIDILYCGICHSDLHMARDEWGGARFPLVPGHEIVGRVVEVGGKVKRFKKGDAVGVGCLVDSCRRCANCREGLEQHCLEGGTFTYGSPDKVSGGHTQGGYSDHIVVDQDFVLKIPKGMALERAAPLLCAGITTYSPLRRAGVKKGTRVGVLGLGGLGHMAVKLARAMGAEVVMLSRSPGKKADAKRLGASEFLLTTDSSAMERAARSLDLIVDTVSAPHDVAAALGLLKTGGELSLVGVPPEPLAVPAFALIGQRKRLSGSLIGGIPETQEMLDFCARKKALADVELIPISAVNEAYERLLAGDVRYRFVIDLKTL